MEREEQFMEAFLDTANSPSDLLLPFEQKAMAEHYRPYYEIKRNNFFASIQGAPDLWRYFQLLDKILLTEFEDMGTAHDPNRMFPLALYFNAQAKIRISIELAFTRCMEEARSILRDAIETAVFAHYMHDDFNLQKIWLSKDDSAQAGKDFSLAFEKDKKAKLFKGLPELYKNWGRLSETGAHSTPQAVVSRFKIIETGTDVHYHMNYTGVEDREWEPETFTLLLTVSVLEKLVFGDYEARLQFDTELLRNRGLAEQLKEKLRREIIKRHNIAPPAVKP
jgi:tetratricopeptide (TPR) repeat protein